MPSLDGRVLSRVPSSRTCKVVTLTQMVTVSAMLDDARGWRLAELRRRRGLTQEQVAVRMGVSVSRVSQIGSGDVSTQDVLARFVTALGGTLKLIADFGGEQPKIA